LAFSQSGEGIRPAIESGLLAAKVIATAHGYSRQQLAAYRTLLTQRFGKSDDHWVTRLGSRLPQGWISTAARKLLANPWFTREMILNRWFLRTNEPALEF
jgi:flavin-dependent dehydrogenase